jgi:hypothetical protein
VEKDCSLNKKGITLLYCPKIVRTLTAVQKIFETKTKLAWYSLMNALTRRMVGLKQWRNFNNSSAVTRLKALDDTFLS